jgi:hypothetical protein
MKRYLAYAVILSLFAAPALLAQDQSDHVEVGVFAEYLRMTDVTPTENFVGLAGRAAFNVYPGIVHPGIQLEGKWVTISSGALRRP